MNSKALTKIQSLILIAIIAIAAVGGGAVYVLIPREEQKSETIKIGVLDDLDGVTGKPNWQAAKLAVEEINAKGGLLGRQVELFGADDDAGTDIIVRTNALTKLITQNEVDFIVGRAAGSQGFLVQDIIAEHKTAVFFGVGSGLADVTQRVSDEYNNYKYYFSVSFNDTSMKLGVTDSLIHIREMTGFNKIGYLVEDLGSNLDLMNALDDFLPENGFELVYKGRFPLGTVDFSSYFAVAEAAGVEILLPLIYRDEGIPFVKEYYDRQSPMVVFGGIDFLASNPNGWEWTDGKCNYMSFSDYPTTTAYPFTSKTLQTRDAYMNKWGEPITFFAALTYDCIKFILVDAVERAGTIDTDAVIEALEETSVETSNARNFVFTESHAVMMGKDAMNNPNADYPIVMGFQWQDGVQVPIDPKSVKEEAGASYMFPDWPGPWDDLN